MTLCLELSLHAQYQLHRYITTQLPILCRKDHWQRALIPPAIDWKASKTRPSRDPDNLISMGIFWHAVADHLFPDQLVWIFYHMQEGLFPYSSSLFETSSRHPIREISHWNEGIIYGWRSWRNIILTYGMELDWRGKLREKWITKTVPLPHLQRRQMDRYLP